jgi:hypothetical protein
MEQRQTLEHEDIIQTIFLGDDDHTVDVVESQYLDFEEVLACVKLGGSVFITCK